MKKKVGKLRLDFFLSFQQLAKYQNFSSTAKMLDRTQGTISMHLKELEEAFGTSQIKNLFIDRTSKKFEITEEGKIIQDASTQILQIIENASNKIDKLIGNKKTKIPIYSSSIPGEYFLPQKFIQFQTKFPQVEFDLLISNTYEALTKLNEEEVAFCAIGGWFDFDPNDFDSKVIGQDEIVILCRQNHPILKEMKELSKNANEMEFISLLLKYPWVFRERGSATRDFFIQKFSKADQITTNLEFHNNTAIIHALENSDALTSLSTQILPTAAQNRSIQILNSSFIPKITRDLYIIKKKDHKLSEIERELWNIF